MDKIISLWEKQQQHDFKKQKEEKPHFPLRTYFKNIAKHSDSMIEDGTATAACQDLSTARLPACSHDSVKGSQRKISVK